MASDTKIGTLVIDLKAKTEALEKGLETAKKKIQAIEQENKNLQNSNSNMTASFAAMAVATVASFVKITGAIKDCVAEYTKYTNSMNALNKTAKATNNTIQDVQSIIANVNEFKLMDESDLNSAIKNLLLYGYTAEQASDILNVLQDSAVGNRQECYSLSEAVRVTTEGIRMENSVLSDAAGVQKNIAKMYEEHAKAIGKTTDSLTQAEKAQAVYNGIMDEASMFTGSAKEMSEQYQGQQAQLNAAQLELTRTIGESMIPGLTQLSKAQKNVIKGVAEWTKENKEATAGIATLVTTMLGIMGATGAAITGITAYRKAAEAANLTTKAFTASILANPLFIGAIAFSAGITALNVYTTHIQNEIDKLDELTEKSEAVSEAMRNFMANGMEYTEAEKGVIQQAVAESKELISEYESRKEKIEAIQNTINDVTNNNDMLSFQKNGTLQALKIQLNDATKELQKWEKANYMSAEDIEYHRQRIDKLSKSLEICKNKQEYLTAIEVSAHREKLIDIAQTKADIKGKQELLNILKQGQTETEAYADAKNQLIKVYPELAKVNENTIKSTQAMINAEDIAAQREWENTQTTVAASIWELQNIQLNHQKIQDIAYATGKTINEVTQSIQEQIRVLSNLQQLVPTDLMSSITPSYTPKKVSTGGGSYSNKRLDNYKKEIEHKKAMDQISIKQEISMYEYALRKYAKTADERNEIRENIYSLNKELANKEKEILEQQTEDYEAYIQQQKNLRGAAYDITEQTKDYNRIIQMHKNYLSQIMKDERLSLDERKAIYREELATIRDYEQQKRDLRVEQIDNTVSQLTNAVTKQLEEMHEKDKELIDKNIESVEKWKEARINAINAEYDARIEAINKELEALDKAEQQKSRDEEDAEYEKKKKRLEELVAFEHDATTKANYQKELDKLIADYQKTIDKRALEDKKEALNAQKDLLAEEQDNKVQAIEDEAEKQKEMYDKQLEDLEKYYDEQIEMAQETAEKMLLNVQKNQDQILNLLKQYGNKYEITGQSLGEKLAQGINDGIAGKIEGIIQKIQNTIDANMERKIKEWTASSYGYEAGANKPQPANINVIQNNYIQQNPEMPSETHRKLKNVSENLAAEIAGAW